ncbi:hypothetical protein EDB80DRAFT_683793 [Ilyonectria destructans]|nr:hypothetical protein EDB80DRAFT_683793 [Ilyonectria destructans]
MAPMLCTTRVALLLSILLRKATCSSSSQTALTSRRLPLHHYCIPKRFDYVKALGADVVFDYDSTTVVQDIKRATGGRLKYSLDSISKEPTKKISVGAFGDDGGIYTTLLPIPAELVYSINDKIMSKFTLA